jgi:hypothetical protein
MDKVLVGFYLAFAGLLVAAVFFALWSPEAYTMRSR